MKELLDPTFFISNFLWVISKGEGDEDKFVKLVPNPMQKDYLAKRTQMNIVVKSRQMGFSTMEMAINFHKCLFNAPYRVGLVAHKDDVTSRLFSTIHRFLQHLPEPKPEVDLHSLHTIRFPLLGSIFYIGTAGGKTFGRAETLDSFHGSEVAYWENPRDIMNSVKGSKHKKSIVTLESTPNGRGGYFYNEYMAAKEGETSFKTFFYPWWWEPNYNLEENSPIALPEDKVSPLEYIDEEKELISLYKLTENQIRWRRAKKAELYDSSMDIDYFRQEYPENDIDCWLVKGFQVFPTESIRQQLFKCSAPYLIEENGLLKIWRLPSPTEKYVIGVDPASGIQGGDYSVAVVLEVRSSTHVATLRGRIPPEHLSAMVDKLGRRYNNALLAVERENHGHSVLALLKKLNYPNLYYHKEYDVSGMAKTSLGWITSSKSRPIMISDFASALKTRSFVTQDETILNEALGMRWKGDRAEAETGEHDDTAFAGMIAYSVRQKYSQYGSLNKVEVKGYGLYRS